MPRSILFASLLIAASLSPAAQAQGRTNTFAVTGLLGVGGALDDEGGFGNPNWQLGFSNNIDERTYFAVRLGGLEWGSEVRLDEVNAPSLLYLTLAGEYHEASGSFSGSYIEAGVFVGLGFYSIDGTLDSGESTSETGPGLNVGLTGDIPLTKRRSWTVRIELSGHYAIVDAAQLFAMAQIGVSYRF